MSDKEDISVSDGEVEEPAANRFVSDEPLVPTGVIERLKEAIERGGDLKIIAARTGISSRTLSRLKRGQQPKLGQLIAIAEAVPCSFEWLVMGKGEPGFPLRMTLGLYRETPDGPRRTGSVTLTQTSGFADSGASAPIPPGTPLDSGQTLRPEDDGIRIRLMEAIEQHGGMSALAEELRIPVGEIVNLTHGLPIRRFWAETLAKAVGISLTRPPVEPVQESAPAASLAGSDEGRMSLGVLDIPVLNAAILRAGGVEQLARLAGVPLDELRTLAGGGYVSVATVKAVDDRLHLGLFPPREAAPVPAAIYTDHAVDGLALRVLRPYLDLIRRLPAEQMKVELDRLYDSLFSGDPD